MLVKPESVTPTYLFNGNLAYNFKLSSGSASPFILAGYDITNCSPGVGVLIVNYDTTIGVLNLGGGLKILVAKNVAVRVEYRYQKFTTEKSLSIYGFSSAASVDINNHTMNVGFSVILQPSSLLLE